MRFAIFSDIHGDWPNLTLALAHARYLDCQLLVCSGDIERCKSPGGSCDVQVFSVTCPGVGVTPRNPLNSGTRQPARVVQYYGSRRRDGRRENQEKFR